MQKDRRSLLKLGLAATSVSGLAGLPGVSFGQSLADQVSTDKLIADQLSTSSDHTVESVVESSVAEPIVEPDRRLRLVNAHTWEKLDLTYWTNGVYLDSSLEQIDHLMRDHRANESRQMDLELLDYMHALYQLSGSDARLHILSGYRTPKTNAALRKRSSGVAKYSLHMEGRAVDINIPDVPTKNLREMAISLQSGGVGYYRRSGFVHIDTGSIRYWQS